MDVWQIVLGLLVLAGTAIAGWLLKGQKIIRVAKELGDIPKALNKALEDGNIDKTEWQHIITQIYEFLVSIGVKLKWKPPWIP